MEDSAVRAESGPLRGRAVVDQKSCRRARRRAIDLHRLLNDSFIAGEQLTPGPPWCIRLTDDIKARFSDDAGNGFLPMREAMRALGVSRQTVLRRVKRGELEAIHVMRGKQKGLRIKVIQQHPNLFDYAS